MWRRRAIAIILAAAAAVAASERAEPTAHFILLATQRTGSTWVMSELSKHSSCIARIYQRTRRLSHNSRTGSRAAARSAPTNVPHAVH